MSPRSVVITGCNRGLGLELVKQLSRRSAAAAAPEHVFATYRSAERAEELLELARDNAAVHAVQMDVTKPSDHSSLVTLVERTVGAAGLNLLVNNAGLAVRGRNALETTTAADMRDTFEVNCVAPLFLTKAFLPLLQRAAAAAGSPSLSVRRAAVVQMSTQMASVAENDAGRFYAYRASKAALNMATKTLSADLRAHGVLVAAVHPGWVRTDMGGPSAPLDAETSVAAMLRTLTRLGDDDHGAFVQFDGKRRIPW